MNLDPAAGSQECVETPGSGEEQAQPPNKDTVHESYASVLRRGIKTANTRNRAGFLEGRRGLTSLTSWRKP